MRLSIMVEPQEGMTYEGLLAVARTVERVGLAGLYRSDHYLSVEGRGAIGSTDAWATLAGLARDTSGITLGTLVSPVTFRPAANLAKVVATVAAMAGSAADRSSRVHVGLGTGWLEAEHRQYGFPFEEVGVRFQRLEEHLAALRGLWDPARQPYDQAGDHVVLEGATFAPVPDPRPRVIVGGRGLRRTPALAARYADELNNVNASPAGCARQRAALDQACERVDRDPSRIGYTLMTGCLIGATEQEFQSRLRRLQQRSGDGRPPGEYAAELSESWVLGTPDQAADRLGALAEAGVEGVALQHLLPDDLEMVELVAAELVPRR